MNNNLPEQFVEFLNSQKKKPSKATVKNYKADILQFIRWFEKQFKKNFDPAEVTSQTIELYKTANNASQSKTGLPLDGSNASPKSPEGVPSAPEHHLSPRSLKRHLSSLRKFFHYLKVEGIIPQDPIEAISNQQSAISNPDLWHIRDFKNYLYVYNASGLTIKNYVMDVKQFMQWAEQVTAVSKEWQASQKNVFDKIDWKLIEEYKLRLISEHFSPLTINRKLSSLRKYVAWAKEQGYIKKEADTSPFTLREKPQSQQEAGILSSMPNVTPRAMPAGPLRSEASRQVKYIPVSPADLKPGAAEQQTHPATPKSYSSIPPFRLGQKIVMAGDFIFDTIFIEPLALITGAFQHLAWKMRGKPVFKETTTQANTPKQVYNVKKGFYAEVSTKNMSLAQKTAHHLRFTRPKWYVSYHSLPFVHYLHFGALVILMCILGFYVFQNLTMGDSTQITRVATGEDIKRSLLFQGKLADSKNAPITNNSSVKFTIYDGENKSANPLWTETIDINPKDDGSFSVVLGNKTPLFQNMFVENYTVWLGIAVENDPELIPRQQLTNVALSENSQTLDGMLPITQSKASNKNVILALDSSGNLTIGGEASSTFQAIGGELVLSGNVLTLTTVAGTNSDIVLSPDGTGKVDIRKQIYNSSNSSTTPGATGAVEIADNLFILASSSAQSALSINQTDVGPLLSASSSGIAKFTIDGLGNTTIAGDLILAGSRISAGALTDANFGNSSFTVGSINTTGNFSQTGNTTFSTGTGSARLNGDVYIGTSSANTITFNARVAQDSSLIPISPTGTNDLGASSFPWDNLYVNNVKPGGSEGQQGWWTRVGTT
ncbi:MAG: site-specific integrase, partial [Candidatus Levyibacteriota bacterium]